MVMYREVCPEGVQNKCPGGVWYCSKLKWSPRTFIKQDDGTVMPKARSFEEVLVVNLVKKRC